MFTLVPGEFENAMDDIYMRETSPSRVLRTGMVGLNIMLDGGFQSSRVYLLMAQAAGGKSFTLLDLAMQLKKHNKNYVAKDPTKIPTIVILTMENSEDENVSRMLGMISQGKTFNDCSFEDSIKTYQDYLDVITKIIDKIENDFDVSSKDKKGYAEENRFA